jgi:hypothetical protein
MRCGDYSLKILFLFATIASFCFLKNIEAAPYNLSNCLQVQKNGNSIATLRTLQSVLRRLSSLRQPWCETTPHSVGGVLNSIIAACCTYWQAYPLFLRRTVINRRQRPCKRRWQSRQCMYNVIFCSLRVIIVATDIVDVHIRLSTM